jgi:hypothetical protein
MGKWTAAVEAKARIIHEQLAAARALAGKNGMSAAETDSAYLELLADLYRDEYAFAELADGSDLVAHFTGPAVKGAEPTFTIVTSVFATLRDQVRGIAKAIVGLSADDAVRWPTELDPHLAGVTHGSLIVGINVRPPEIAAGAQQSLPAVSDRLFESVRSAVRSLAVVGQHVAPGGVSDSIIEDFPDPAVRDTVLVAASRLAPSGRRGIDQVTFIDSDLPLNRASTPLTPDSRRALKHAITKPLRVSGSGEFEGVVREIDLDAMRFEIRRVRGAGAIRCVYTPDQQNLVRTILDASVRVGGNFEASENKQPRLVAVKTIELLARPPQQVDIQDADR